MSACAYCGEQPCLVHCVYCLTDCSVEEPEHGPACPSVTGRYPIDPESFPRGVDGISCMRCHADLEDFYYLVVVEQGEPLLPGLEGAEVTECVCFECKVATETTV